MSGTGAAIPAKLASDEAVTKTFTDSLVDALAVLDGILGSTMGEVLPNGSFETYVTGATTPANWVRTLLQNGAGAVEESVIAHGQKAYKFTRVSGASNGGGQLTSSQFVPVGEGHQVSFKCSYKATAALQSTVELIFADEDESTVETRTVCTITAATSWRTLFYTGYVPAGAYLVKIRLTGGTTAVDVAGSAYFDGIEFSSTALTPVMDGQEYTDTAGAYITVLSIPLPIPSDATTVAATVELKTDSASYAAYFRAVINGTNGSEQSTVSTTYVSKTSSITVAAGDKGDVLNLELQIKTSPPGTATMQALSDISNGFEAKISIT